MPARPARTCRWSHRPARCTASRQVVGDAAHGFDDHDFALQMLEEEDVLIVPGSSFNVPYRNHFRVTLLPEATDAARSVRAHRARAVAPRRNRR